MSNPIALTPAERRIIDLLLQGMTRQAAADRLGVQPPSVSTALRTARERNDLRNNDALLEAVKQRGMVDYRKRSSPAMHSKPATPYESKPVSERAARSQRIREREAAKKAALLAQMGRA